MNAIDKLVEDGRDPLEVLLVPPSPDVAKWLEEDKNKRLDRQIARELATWLPEMRERLWEIVMSKRR